MLNSRDDLILATLNSSEQLHSENFEYKSLFLNFILPDETNARFLPCVFIENEHAKQYQERRVTRKQLIDLYDANYKVIIGKGCILNCLEHGTHNWKKANQTIESIIELGENIAVSEMIQVPTVYPVGDSRYQILTGHRRFFALLYTFGIDCAAQFKVYEERPLLYKVKQFQENASREDLPQYGKLQAFISAMNEIEGVEQAKLKIGKKKLTVKDKAKHLGISMGAFDNYNVLTRYSDVVKAYEDGLCESFIKVKKIVLGCEVEYKVENNKTVLSQKDKECIASRISAKISAKHGRDRREKAYNLPKITQPKALKKLLFSNANHLDSGVDWDALDWTDHDEINGALKRFFKIL
ncbi:hypothetical protein L1286_08970 [Pseudoalteromonas sp. SMS1]|uniref:hypothetical protein n=1 Tax=Pseudoalteromonas sp. SMS1 TaxID=2908894 RepID=UPI001F1AD057|nr:hypothetical protein [Pseudoalteromonas sp. SMS1]MCF2857600.1 hypothetical protein [Pseudoalteromonas sp. SMS1]